MEYRDLFDSDRELCRERYELAEERITALAEGEISPVLPEDWRAYFQKMAAFIRMTMDFRKAYVTDDRPVMSHEDLRGWNQKLYAAGELIVFGKDVKDGRNHEASRFFCPPGAGSGSDRLLLFMKEEILGMVRYAFEGRVMEMTILMELYIQVYCQIESIGQEILERWGEVSSDRLAHESVESLQDTLYYYVSDYADLLLDRRIGELTDPAFSFLRDFVMASAGSGKAESGEAESGQAVSGEAEFGEDMPGKASSGEAESGEIEYIPANTDIRDSLYVQGDPVSADSLRLAEQAGKMTDDAVKKLADSWFLACREMLDACTGTGDRHTGSGKGTVRIMYPMGLERVVACLISRLEEEGYAALCCRPSVSLIAKPWRQSRVRDQYRDSERDSYKASDKGLYRASDNDSYKDSDRNSYRDSHRNPDPCKAIAGPDLFLDNALKERRLSVMRKAAEDRKSQIRSLLCTLVLKEEMDQKQKWISDGTGSTGYHDTDSAASAASYTRRQQLLLEKMTEEEARIIPGGLSPEEDPRACVVSFSFRQMDKIGKN